jgi:uncharacterized membrane protein
MAAAIPNPPYEVPQDERTLATLAHVLQLVTTWMGPLVIFFLKPHSLFVRFHALQALLLQICLTILWIVAIGIFFATMFTGMWQSGGMGHNAPPPAVFAVFPILWLLGMSAWAVILIVAIVFGIKAGRGEWAEYPVLGGLARHLLKM